MIADALTQLLTNPELTERIGKQAQNDFFKQHSYDKFITEMYQLYRL